MSYNVDSPVFKWEMDFIDLEPFSHPDHTKHKSAFPDSHSHTTVPHRAPPA